MSALSKKLWRTVWNTRGQFLASVLVVVLGISIYISMNTAYYNLARSKELFYQETNFADYYFHVIKAPEEVVKQIEQIPGVARVTGRIQKDVPVIKQDNQRATARLISYPVPMDTSVNRLRLLEGRIFEKNPPGGGIEVLTDPQYWSANNLAKNNRVTIVAEGRKVPLTAVGAGTSPEFIYPMRDASSLMPEPETFGIVMIPQNQAQQLLNLTGQINQVVIKLAPGSNEKQIAGKIEAVLEPYGNLAGYPRKQQLSHAVLQAELDGLRATSRALPLIFLVIAVAIQFVMLGRMVKAQRLQIGIMKALGYNNRQIMLHYAGYALLVSAVGAVLGCMLGLWFASAISQTYTKYFNLPAAIGGVNYMAIFYGSVLSVAVGLTAGLTASRGVAAINPAEAMRPEPPKGSGSILLEKWDWLWRKLHPTWKMGLRAASRNKTRFGVTLAGVAFAVSLLVVSLCANDSIDYLINKYYFKDQNYNYMVRFTAPVKEGELGYIRNIDGVLRAEPFFELPAKIFYQGRDEDDLLFGVPPDLTLKKLEDSNGRELFLPEEGLLINAKTAKKLGVAVGDIVQVETKLGLGPNRINEVKIIGTSNQLIGSMSYISLRQVNQLLRESGLASGVMLKADPGRGPELERKLNDLTGVSSVMSRQKEIDSFNRNLDTMIYFTGIMVAFAALLGFAIVYNTSVMSFAERKRELASMLVLGFTNKEVAGLLFKETMLQSMLGVALGLPMGYLIAQGYMQAMNTELYSLPLVIYPKTYLISALGGIVFVMVGHLMAARGVNRLDMVEVLKNRD